MKQAPNARKQRARTGPPRKGGKPNNSGGSNGGNRNDNRSRGNPKQLLEKFKTQARDALQAGDRVNAGYYFQFADHYQRVVNEMQVREPRESQNREPRDNNHDNRDNRDQGSDDNQRNRRDRGRRGRNGDQQERRDTPVDEQKNQTVDAAPVETGVVGADVAATEQPQEVHPELDLAPTVDVEEKPKRRAPVRRRAPKKEVDAAEAGDEKPKPRARRPRKPKEETASAASNTDAPNKDGEAAA